MQQLRRRLRTFSWIAIFAMLGLALAPTLSHALVGAGSFNPWVELCSATGNKWAPATVGDPADRSGGESAMHLEHCPLCGQTGHAPVLPSAEATPMPSAEGADFLPALFADAPRPLFAWLSVRPRGPPAAD